MASSTTAPQQPGIPTRVPRRVMAAILLGTVLNPINSSMIAVALVRIQRRLRRKRRVAVVADLQLLSGRGGRAVGAGPARGPVRTPARAVHRLRADRDRRRARPARAELRLADRGAAAAGGWHVGRLPGRDWRCCATPRAGTGRRRRHWPRSRSAGSSSAALGPVVGGALVALAGWQAIFFVNAIVGVVALPLSLRWLPRDPQHEGGVSLATVRRLVDLPGIAAFTRDARERARAAAVARRRAAVVAACPSRSRPASRSY